MPLSGRYAQALGLIEDSTSFFAGVRECSYDLQIDTVIVNGQVYGPENVDLEISPQQSFTIISREVLHILPGFVGYAFLKTSIARQGILAINTGVIDPGWHNRLATTAINFSNYPFAVFGRGSETAFLRIAFERVERGVSETVPSAEGTRLTHDAIDKEFAEYIRDQVRLSKRFPPTFLDIPGQQTAIIARAKDEIIKDGWRRIGWVDSIVAIVALVLSAVTPILASVASQAFLATQSQTEQAKMDKELDSRIRSLESQIIARDTHGQRAPGNP